MCELVEHRMLLMVDLKHLLVDLGSGLWSQVFGRLRQGWVVGGCGFHLRPGDGDQPRQNSKALSQNPKQNALKFAMWPFIESFLVLVVNEQQQH